MKSKKRLSRLKEKRNKALIKKRNFEVAEEDSRFASNNLQSEQLGADESLNSDSKKVNVKMKRKKQRYLKLFYRA